MTLQEIYDKLVEFVDQNGDVFGCYDEENEEAYQAFDDLQDEIFNENQTYFTWDVENDTFRISKAFYSVLQYLHEQNKTVSDFFIDYIGDDKLIVLVETK